MDKEHLVLPQDEHNRELVANVHPESWTNPEPAGRYNMVVLGAGTAGLVTAAGAAGLGARVALIENRLLGGDCLNTGCVPSKGIIRSARAIHDIRSAGEFGADPGTNVSVDFAKIMERMRRIRAGISRHDSALRYSRELGVDVFIGTGTFSGPDTISVGGKRLQFAKAAICTGTRPAIPEVPGIAEAGCLTNETIFWLTRLPKRLAVIGGGPVGVELAQSFARMGSRVTVLQQDAQILPREDADAAGIIQRTLRKDGVDIRLNAKVRRIERRGAEKIIVLQEGENAIELPVDEILAASGRTPNVDGLGLESAGIKYDNRLGVLVNDRLQTTNPHVFAAGDVCSSYKFTHAADAMARIVIANALFKARQSASSLVIPWCIYTDPEVAHVGISERDAAERGVEMLTLTVPLTEVDRALLDGETEGFARVYLKKGSDRILGATIVARHAGEMINELTLAMTAGLGLSAIGRTVHPYPTQAEAVRKLADAYNRTRLTPFIKKLFMKWLAWQRSCSR